MKRRASKLGKEKANTGSGEMSSKQVRQIARRSLSFPRLTLSVAQPKILQKVKKVQMKRVSLASSYTQAHLMDVRLTERMTTGKPRMQSFEEGGGNDSDEDNFL